MENSIIGAIRDDLSNILYKFYSDHCSIIHLGQKISAPHQNKYIHKLILL